MCVTCAWVGSELPWGLETAANSLPWSDLLTGVPAVPLADAKSSGVLVLSLVMVSSGRKMVPVLRVFVQLSVELLLCRACETPAELWGG